MGGGIPYHERVQRDRDSKFNRDIVYGVVGSVAVIALVGWLVSGLADDMRERDKAARAEWEGAKIVRICFDGTRIFRMRDGSYRTSLSSIPVESPDVCSMEKP